MATGPRLVDKDEARSVIWKYFAYLTVRAKLPIRRDLFVGRASNNCKLKEPTDGSRVRPKYLRVRLII